MTLHPVWRERASSRSKCCKASATVGIPLLRLMVLIVDSCNAARTILSLSPPQSVIPSEVEGPCVLLEVNENRDASGNSRSFDCEEKTRSEFLPFAQDDKIES